MIPGPIILVVDDEPASRIALRKIFVAAGYQFAGASTGAEALERMRMEEGTVKLAESRLGRSRVGQVNGRDEDPSRPDLRRPSLPC